MSQVSAAFFEQVEAKDYPKPAFETSGPFLEAAILSARIREAPRPERPLRIAIAGAGKFHFDAHCTVCRHHFTVKYLQHLFCRAL